MLSALCGPDPHMQAVYRKAPSLHINQQPALEHLPCTDFTGNHATPECCVMTEPLPGTQYHCIRYGASYFSHHWTNRYCVCCHISLRAQRKAREGDVFIYVSLHHLSRL